MSEDEQVTFEALLVRRRGGEPLQYIEETVPFGHVEIHVDDRVLIPRPETEYLLELVASRVVAPRIIVDLCTGSGNLAVALSAMYPDAAVYAVDLSADAVDVARMNAAHNDANVHVSLGDLFEGLPREIRGRVDLLVSNPPYLAADELRSLPDDVLAEPEMALVAGPKGDEVLERIAAQADGWLSDYGFIACEISEFHSERVAELFERYDVEVLEDLTGRDRYVVTSASIRYR